MLLGDEATLCATFYSSKRSQGGMIPRGHGVMIMKNGDETGVMEVGISVKPKGNGWLILDAVFRPALKPRKK